MTNQLCVLCVVKNCYLLITIFPMANMRRTYEGIGICVDDQSFAIVFFMNFELGVSFFDEKTMILSHTYEGEWMFVDDWKMGKQAKSTRF